MDLQGLRIFAEIAELKSFTKAGDRLGYSQPTISFQIKQLERELGIRLFDRIGHTVSLTEAGRNVLTYAQRILVLSQEMTDHSGLEREPEGDVRIGMADSLCAPLIAGGFGEFRRLYPKVSLNITTAGTAELFRMLNHNEVDLVCTLDNHIYDTSYVIADEEEIGVHFVVSAQNPIAQRKEHAVTDLLTCPFLLTEKGMSYRRMLDERLAKESLEIQPVLEMGSADLICRLVEENMGASFLPDYVTEAAVKRGTLVRLDVKDYHVELWKQMLYRRDKWLSKPMMAFIGYLKNHPLQKNVTVCF